MRRMATRILGSALDRAERRNGSARRRWALGGTALGISALLLSGCGSDSSAPEEVASDGTTTSAAPTDAAATPLQLDAAASAELAGLCAAVNVGEITQASEASEQSAAVLNTLSPESADTAVLTWLQSTGNYFATFSEQLAPLFAVVGQQTGDASWDEVVDSLATAGQNLQGLATEVEGTGFTEANQGQIESALDLPGLNSNPFEKPAWQEITTSIPECATFGDAMDVLLTPTE